MLLHIMKYHEKPLDKLCQVAASVCRAFVQEQGTRDQAPLHLSQENNFAICRFPKAKKVLRISLEESVAWVQPDVTMGELVQSTIKEGLIPTVVTSSRDTTVLKAFTSKTCGSSSFRYGTFDCAVLSVQGISRDGHELTIDLNDADTIDEFSRNDSALHRLALLKIPLMQAGQYVEMTYWPVLSLSGATFRVMCNPLILGKHAVNEFTDFLDIVMFGPELGAVVTGRFMAAAQPICRPFGERVSFLKHAESIVRERKGKPGPAYVETVPLVDYLFRYYDDNGESTQDYASMSQYVALPAEALEDYVKDAYWQFSSDPVRITLVEPHSTFSKRGFGMPAASEGDLWHVEQLDATERKNQCQNIGSLPA